MLTHDEVAAPCYVTNVPTTNDRLQQQYNPVYRSCCVVLPHMYEFYGSFNMYLEERMCTVC